MTIKRVLQFLINVLSRVLGNSGKKRLVSYLISDWFADSIPLDLSCAVERKIKRENYRLKLWVYEQNYDHVTGGWKNPENGQIDYASIELEVGKTWNALVRLLKPKNILETGIHEGYSTCCLASALYESNNNGHIYCVDPQEIAHLWENTELEALISWYPVRSQESIRFFNEIDIDLLVIDSYHDYKTVMWELANFEPLLKINGHILLHDSLYYDGVGAAVKQLYENPRFELVTIDSSRTHNRSGRCPGITIVRKIRHGVPLTFENKYQNWFIGNPEDIPFLRRYLNEKASTEFNEASGMGAWPVSNSYVKTDSKGAKKGWRKISGTVSCDGNPVCAVVIANGQFLITRDQGPSPGGYELEAPLDENGEITVQAFVAGRAPYKKSIKTSHLDINMWPASPKINSLEVTSSVTKINASNPSGGVEITGTVHAKGIPLCAMVLANGQHLFSNGTDSGKFTLSVPLDRHGQIVLHVFADGFLPYKRIISTGST